MEHKLKTLFAALCCAGLALSASANEIVRGTTLTDGQQLYASDLHNLVDTATIGVQFYNDQQTTPALNAGYYFLVLDPANQVFRRITAQTVLYANTNIYLNVPFQPVPSYGDVLFFDPTNNWIGNTSISNLFFISTSNINVSALQYVNTNDAGATNQYLLPPWPWPNFSGFNTNNPEWFIMHDSNGVPYRQSLSNLEASAASDLGTNLLLPFTYEQTFFPWLVYGTNTVNFTNAWGTMSNFAITSLYWTNTFNPTNTTPTITAADSIPIQATGQETNTTVTIGTILQYMQSQNALPNYTQARASFNGVDYEANMLNAVIRSPNEFVTNSPFSSNAVTPFVIWTSPTGGGALAATTPQLVVNQCYYAVGATAPATNYFFVFTNYLSATNFLFNAVTNCVSINALGTGTNQIAIVTNYSGFNADVTPVANGNGNAVSTGVYDVWFRTPALDASYYVSGISGYQQGLSQPLVMDIAYNVNGTGSGGTYNGVSGGSLILTTNQVRIDFRDVGNTPSQPRRAYVLISPD